MSSSSPAFVAVMSGRTIAAGDTLRSRMPTSEPMPTWTPAEIASIHSRTGIAQATTNTTMSASARKIAFAIAT